MIVSNVYASNPIVTITLTQGTTGTAWSGPGNTLTNLGPSPSNTVLKDTKTVPDHKYFRTQQRGKRWEK